MSDAAAIEFAIGRKQDPLEMFLRRALGSKRLISLTLKSGKVYIGTLQSNFNPAFSMESISLLLSHSGYRDKNTLQMRLAIDYQQTHQKILADLKEKYKDALEQALSQKPEATNEELKASVGAEFSAEAEVQHFEIIIPVTEIQSVNLFDEKIYDEYFRKKTPILSSYRMQ